MTLKGYPTALKDSHTKSEYVNVKQVAPDTYALVTYNYGGVYQVGTDTTEAGSNQTTIVATAHGAAVGDLIRLTTGTYAGYESRIIDVVDANTFILDRKFITDIGAGVDFTLLRGITQLLGPDGGISVSFPYDTDFGVVGATTLRTAAEIGNATGAADFGSGVQGAQTLRTTPATDGQHRLSTRHEAAITPLSARLSDGTAFYQGATETTAANIKTDTGNIATDTSTIAGDTTSIDTKFNVNLSTIASQATLANIETDTGNIDASLDVALSTRASEATLSTLNAKITSDYGVSTAATRTAAQIGNASGVADFGSGTVSAQTVRTTPASNSPHLLATRHEAATTPLAVRISTGSSFPSQLSVLSLGLTAYNSYTRDYSVSGLTAGTWSEVVSSVSSNIHEIEVFDSSGEILELGFGAAASEQRKIYIPPGGNGRVRLLIPSGTRISIKCASNVSLGNFVINFYGE